ncbi:thioredoxin family protein [Mesoterricola sediminis]|uniref:Thioredoxin family protein n=1 Tax=Mesoterricola sediminis TaxID=2927980 RepID=A0AA48HGF3_9BACT|nr:thioredoxin family protein [Mesoterricola sediminis]BDU77748.1 thioredoxin family protein [Mesoterricola sediminis]
MNPRILLVPVLAATLPAFAAEPARPAQELLDAARKAAAPDRAVFVAFHASWCSWCRRLEGVLARPEVKAVLDRHFVVQWLTVQERGEKKLLDNPGAAELYARWTGGAPSGIPFYGILDAQGTLKGTSLRVLEAGKAPENLGYPGSDAEIGQFLAFLKEGAPKLTAAEAEVIRGALDAAKPRPKA